MKMLKLLASLGLLILIMVVHGCASVGSPQAGSCFLCDVWIPDDNNTGGRVLAIRGKHSMAQVNTLASENCRTKGANGANLSSPVDFGSSIRNINVYNFTCYIDSPSAVEAQNPSIKPQSVASPFEGTSKTDSKSVDSAKKDCRELGFKPGTKDFGNCVLKLLE